MQGKIASVIGGSGLIGSQILQLLLQDQWYSEVRALVRKPIDISHQKLKQIIVDFSDRSSFEAALAGCHVVFCAVGTTQQKVRGDMQQYRKVDYDIPVHAAEICLNNGIEHFSLVSSVGADSSSRNFYLKLKGEVEDDVMKLKLPSVSIVRPSMLLGDRREFRLAEKMAQAVMRPLSFLIPSKYKPIHAQRVAAAMIAESKRKKAGITVLHYKEMVGVV